MDEQGVKLLTSTEVKTRIGWRSTASIYNAIKKYNFPAPVKITPRISRWPEPEVERWIAERR